MSIKDHSFLITISAGLFSLSLTYARADSSQNLGADLLLNSVAPQVGSAPEPIQEAPQQAKPQMPNFQLSGIKLDDPFSMQLFSDWQQQRDLSYELNAWVMRVLKGEYEQAAHQWTSIQNLIPDSFSNSAKAAWLFTLWKLDVPQSFFDQWALLSMNSNFAESRASKALDKLISPGFDQWIMKHAIFYSPEQEAFLKAASTQSKGALSQTLQAWSLLRKGIEAKAVLSVLPMTHLFKIPLAQTMSLALAKSGDLAGAGRILKTQLEPAIEANGDPLLLSTHYLQIARLLYQIGALDGAETYYERIPSGAPEFFKAREELTWVWLRKGDHSKLRGHLKTLSSKLFDDKFAPEVPLVRAISNLKLCFYDEVEKDFKLFMQRNAPWATQIDQALNTENPPVPPRVDFYSQLAEKSETNITNEAKKIEVLAQRSIQAVLPAVGPQSHWIKMRDRMIALSTLARKARAQEYRRQWLNNKFVLSEAIRKMQFVKVEVMSQVRQLARSDQDQLTVSQAAALKGPKLVPDPRIEDTNKVIFPFDGVLWADEMFHLRSMAQNRCLKGTRGTL